MRKLYLIVALAGWCLFGASLLLNESDTAVAQNTAPRGGNPCPGCTGDLNGDMTVDVFDLFELLNAWGPCPSCPNGSPCDDGDPCTVADTCIDGQCVGTPIDCSDGDPCTIDYCMNGQCFHDPDPNCCPDGNACDDGDPCTINDTCIDGDCVGTPIDCDDGDPCTIDYCENGICVHDPDPNCD